jgi:MFS family permease
VRRLVAAEVVSPTGDALATTVLILHLQRTVGTGTAIGALLVAEALPHLLAPVTGAIADRARSRARLAAACLVAEAGVVLFLALTMPPLAGIAVLVFARATLAAVVDPSLGALVPALVAADNDGDGDDHHALPRANALLVGGRELGTVIGPPLGGLLFAVADGPRPGLVVDAATFVAAALLVRGLHTAAADAGTGRAPLRGDVLDGLRYVWRTPAIKAIAVGFWVTVLLSASDDLALPFLATRDLHAGPVGVGVLLAAASTGLLLGLPLVRPVHRRLTLAAAVVAGMGVVAAGNIATAVAPVLAAAFAAQVVRGVGIPLIDTSVRTMVQRDAPPRLLGRALANVYGGVSAAAALGYVVGGPLLDATSPRAVLAVVGTGGLAGAAVTASLGRRARRSTASPER